MPELLNSTVGIWGLFVSAFVSATIAPGTSEALLVLMITQSNESRWVLVFIATLGNVLGAMTTWLFGVVAAKGYSVKTLSQGAVNRVKRWGVAALFFSWLPIIGDALCFAAGWLGLPFIRSLIAIAIGKVFRYAIIATVLV